MAKQCISKCVLWIFLKTKFIELKCAAGEIGAIHGITEEQVNSTKMYWEIPMNQEVC